MKRPSNLHGYSGSSPFLSPMIFVGAGVNEGSVGHLNACSDVDETVDAGWNVPIGSDERLRGAWKLSARGVCKSTK